MRSATRDPRRQGNGHGNPQRAGIYAWPLEYGKTGRAVWRLTLGPKQTQLYRAENKQTRYSGATRIPPGNAHEDGQIWVQRR